MNFHRETTKVEGKILYLSLRRQSTSIESVDEKNCFARKRFCRVFIFFNEFWLKKAKFFQGEEKLFNGFSWKSCNDKIFLGERLLVRAVWEFHIRRGIFSSFLDFVLVVTTTNNELDNQHKLRRFVRRSRTRLTCRLKCWLKKMRREKKRRKVSSSFEREENLTEKSDFQHVSFCSDCRRKFVRELVFRRIYTEVELRKRRERNNLSRFLVRLSARSKRFSLRTKHFEFVILKDSCSESSRKHKQIEKSIRFYW